MNSLIDERWIDIFPKFQAKEAIPENKTRVKSNEVEYYGLLIVDA